MHDGRKPRNGATAANSNTRLSTGLTPRTAQRPAASAMLPRPTNSNTRMNLGPGRPLVGPNDKAWPVASRAPDIADSRRREQMVQRLLEDGITDRLVLEAMRRMPRHAFVDEALASRAYDNAALPIGHGQTISQPRIVAHMIQTARQGRELHRVLEVGTGCGYQAAVLAGVAREVFSVERVRPLHEQAVQRLRALRLPQVRLILGDGTLGLPAFAPFDAIVVAAAGLAVPRALLEQLAVGGRLVAPEGGAEQRLVVIERQPGGHFKRTEGEAVRFVPLQTGVQL
ncbi:protein-L-isoaspartate(D-aspartate) O-methyltransferase [Verticiella alkaliphila]|uniref:protein-L-isoaspartate(D-aspartate) O-methyltransferase n=1 Tax=Verticiella alkaliphila TaxID=2779529 RepID=UPI00209B1A35|nr:protein-L-isoaspartate(D-aspartate) O-methyltransferase [Verticiella sp. GG226]